MKLSRILLALAVLAGLVVLGALFDGRAAPSAPATPGGPWFEVRMLKPRMSRPLFGLLPDGAFGLPPDELRFDSASSGAAVVAVGPGRLECVADGWSLVLETGADGRVAVGTRIVFPIELADKLLSLRCRPAELPSGYLRTTPRPDSELLDGEFSVEFTACEMAGSGKSVEWPAGALIVRGSFTGLSPGSR